MTRLRRGAVPPDYREVLDWRVPRGGWPLIVGHVLSFGLAAVSGLFFFWFAIRFGRLRGIETGTASLVALLVAIVFTLILHELAHGIAMQLCGARPEYGVLWSALAFYATAPGYAFSRNQYLATILAPLAGLSLLAIVGMMAFAGSPLVAILAIGATLNAGGAISDVRMALLVARYPARARVIDERDGMRIFLPA